MKDLPSNAAFCRSGCGAYNHQSGNRATMLTMPKNPTHEPVPDTSPAGNMPEERLDSWKEIAAYLNRDVTTVQRWEKREGMPVHRHLHDKRGSVYALCSEIDAWRHSRKLSLEEDRQKSATEVATEPKADRPATTSRLRRWFVLSPAVAVLALLAFAYVRARIRAGMRACPKSSLWPCFRCRT